MTRQQSIKIKIIKVNELSKKESDIRKLQDEIENDKTKLEVIGERIKDLEREQVIVKQTI